MERNVERYLNPDIFVNVHGDILVNYLGAAIFLPLSVIIINLNIAGVDFNIGNYSADFGIGDNSCKRFKLLAIVKVNHVRFIIGIGAVLNVEFSSLKGGFVKPASIKILVFYLDRVFVEKVGIGS